MEENLDKLFIKIIMASIVISIVILYRIIHHYLYLSGKKNFFKIFQSQVNPADSIHYYARILSASILIYPLILTFQDDFLSLVVHLSTWSLLALALFISSIFFVENTILNHFDYKNEILKKENYAYAIISGSLSICFALAINFVIKNADFSIPIVIILWFLTLIYLGVSSKIFTALTSFHFFKDILSKNLGASISFAGFMLGSSLILFMCLDQEYVEFGEYFIQMASDLTLCLFFAPIFYLCLKRIYLRNNHYTTMLYIKDGPFQLHLVAGLTEGTLFLASSILTILTVFNLGIR
jgi:uncharacterized membrane protein YjfL (UPF0719 family)